jgi:DNA-binding LytR/AlgR family response regulator
MNILIIEDEKIASERLIEQLRKIRPEYNVVAVLDGVEAATEWFATHQPPDLIFLDIQLSDGYCFDIFKDSEILSPVIFTTAYQDFIMKSFELNSIDYLLKPVDLDKLNTAVDKFEKMKEVFRYKLSDIQLLQVQAENGRKNPCRIRFLIPQHFGYVPVMTENIAYIRTEGFNVEIVTKKNESYIFRSSLDKIEQELDPQKFWRANRSYIVAADAIIKVSNYFNYKIKLELSPPTRNDVVVSRKKVSEFKQWYVT